MFSFVRASMIFLFRMIWGWHSTCFLLNWFKKKWTKSCRTVKLIFIPMCFVSFSINRYNNYIFLNLLLSNMKIFLPQHAMISRISIPNQCIKYEKQTSIMYQIWINRPFIPTKKKISLVWHMNQSTFQYKPQGYH